MQKFLLKIHVKMLALSTLLHYEIYSYQSTIVFSCREKHATAIKNPPKSVDDYLQIL